MTDQFTLFAAAAARDDGMVRVDAHALPEWKHDAWAFIVDYLRSHPELFVDDLWEAGLPHTREDRALGPLFNRAARRGLMVKTGRYRASVRSNLTEKPIWRSLIFEAA